MSQRIHRPIERFWPYVEKPEEPTAQELAALDPDLHATLFGRRDLPFSITLVFPPFDGPVHRYIGASPGCWALYSPLVVGEQPDPLLLGHSRVTATSTVVPSRRELGAFVVDAYAVQHHGDASPQAVQSVAVHLLTLHGILARGLDPSRAIWLRLRPLRTRGVF